MSATKNQSDSTRHVSVRLSITRHGRSGWRWTMLLTSDDDSYAVAAEFQSDEDGRGTWMRMIGEDEWAMITPPEERAYPLEEKAAHAEIAQVCAQAATELVGRAQGAVPARTADRKTADLADLEPMGSC